MNDAMAEGNDFRTIEQARLTAMISRMRRVMTEAVPAGNLRSSSARPARRRS